MRASTCLAFYKPTIQRVTKVGALPRMQNQRLSTVTRPYAFHIGVSWAGKPHQTSDSGFKIPFPSDGLIGSWRDQTLARPKAIKSTDAGEDFFFVQEVRLLMLSCYICGVVSIFLSRCRTAQYVHEIHSLFATLSQPSFSWFLRV